MNKVYTVWIGNDYEEPLLIGVATTKDKANQMAIKMCEVFEDNYEYSICCMNTNTLTINDEDIKF